MTHPTPRPLTTTRGWARLCRSTAAAAAIALTAGIGATGVAQAAETQPGPVVAWVTRPVDPQPVVAGHEGDILLEVNVVMAGTAAQQLPVTAAKVAKASKAAKAKHRR